VEGGDQLADVAERIPAVVDERRGNDPKVGDDHAVRQFPEAE
jgi:hypothetical protein